MLIVSTLTPSPLCGAGFYYIGMRHRGEGQGG